jgi:translation initiation factor IF-2
LFEGWGGETLCAEISAKNNINIDKLLDNILLVAEIENFVTDPKRDGLAVVLEAHLDPQKGPVATALVRTGTLRIGQDVFAGSAFGRIRRMEDFKGANLAEAGPSMPVTIYGFSDAPQVNDIVQVVSDKTLARLKSKEASLREGGSKKNTVGKGDGEAEMPTLSVVLKADVQGSLEAIDQILQTIPNTEVALEIISQGVGNITESDIKIAEGAEALVVGFNVTPTAVAKRMAETSSIKIETYSVIYQLVEELKSKLSALLPPEMVRTDIGKLKVLAVFKTGKRDMIVGGRVSEGKLQRGTELEVVRDKEVIGRGTMANLQQNKKNVDEVGQGNECGVVFDGNVKIQENDTLLCFKEEEKLRSL